jgi:Kef-type K+ transport system membrane component KefB
VAAEIFLVGAVLVVAVLLGRWLSIRLEVPEAAVYVVLGGLVGCCPGWRRSSSPRTSCCCCSCPR